MTEQYQVRTPTVIHEVFEDEVVIVNLDSGDYYSLSDAGVACWNCLLTGCTLEQTLGTIGSQYEGDPDDIKTAVQSLIEELEEANLIVRGPQVAPKEMPKGTDDSSVKTAFVAPVLNRYSDMRDLLLIDPIHDVDESGWPQVKDESGEATTE